MYRKSALLLSLVGICLMTGTASAQLVVKINFQLDTAAVPEGYLMDCGQVFADRGNGYSYGWSADATADDRERSANADKRYDTLVHFSKNADKTWEIELPAGEYDLFFVCGDPSNTDQTNTLDVEGVIFTDPDGQDNFDEYSGTVVVTDGRLSIKPASGASNAKICFIDIVQLVVPTMAMDPVPEDGATDVVRDAILGWTAPEGAAKHHVYLGTSLNDVNDATLTNDLGVLVGADQTATTYEPANVLPYGQTYYWRVDEVNAVDGTVTKGELWTFTVEPLAYPIESVTATASSSQANMGPQNTVNRSGLNADDQHSTELKETWLSTGAQPNWIQYEFAEAGKVHELWVWNSNQLIENLLGFGAKDVTIEYSLDGVTWTELADVPEFAQATSQAAYVHNTTVGFGGVSAKYVRLTINTTWGGGAITGLSEVRFFAIPVQAREPEPADAATEVAADVTLNWRPGREAASHAVYFGRDADAVADGTAATDTVSGHSYNPADVEYGRTYYWRVDEVNESMDPGVYTGPVWSFTTADYGAIDDFEVYNDTDVLLYEFWVDGLTDEKSGSMAGYIDAIDGTFGERTIVHSGTQSMPVTYDNASKFSFSEVTRTFDTAQDWTAHGVESLVVYFSGVADNTGQLYLKINNTKVSYTGDATDIASPAWHPWVVDLSTVSGTLDKVTKLTIGVEGSGSKGILYIDDIRLYRVAPRPVDIQILWVSFHGADDAPSSGAAGNAFTEAPDKAYTDLLKANGYDVVRYIQTGTPDLDIVNAARLVIISRSVASGSFQDAAATTWNTVVAPMMNLNGYTIRNSRLGFATGATIPDTTGDIKLTIADTAHPIFAGIPLTNRTMTKPYAGVVSYPDGTVARGLSIVSDAAASTGTVLATVSTGSSATGPAGAMVIGEWPAGATLTHSGGAGTDVLGGHRLVFLTGAREADGKSAETAGLFDLTDDGTKMFLNAVAYMLQ